MVGFNRRFAPLAVRTRELLAGVAEPKTLVMTVNAGVVPADHWTQDPERGGGRVIGEGCHFIDLLRYLVGSPIVSVQSASVGGPDGFRRDDKITFTLSFADGSLGTVHYFGNGSKSFPKERMEAFCAGRVLRLDNWRSLTGYGWPKFRRLSARRQDKGHEAEMRAVIAAVASGGPAPIPLDEILEVTRTAFEVVERAALRVGP